MLYQFGDWQVDTLQGEVRRGDDTQSLQPKVIAVLQQLLEQPGKVVSVDRLIAQVWGNQMIEPIGVARNIALIRRVLGDNSRQPKYIETLPKRGYRAIAPVSVVDQATASGSSPSNGADTGALAPTAVDDTPRSSFTKASILTASLAALVLAVTAIWLYTNQASTSQESKSIALLPWVDLSESGSYAYLADGMVIELAQTLANMPGIHVASQTATSRFKDSQSSLTTIGEALNVHYIVEGTVRVSDGTVRLTAQLVEVANGFHLWSKTYERQLSDVLQLQVDLSREIVAELPLLIDDPNFVAAIEAGTTNTAAYDAYLQARAITSRVQYPEQLDKARTLLQRAIDIDPHFYEARAVLAGKLAMRANLPGGGEIKETIAEAIALLEQVERLDVDKTRRFRTNSLRLLYGLQWDWQNKEALVHHELTMNAPEARWFTEYGMLLHRSGLPQTALAYLKLAETLEPTNPGTKFYLGHAQLDTGNYLEAHKTFTECVALAPSFGECISFLGYTFAVLGDIEKGLELFGKGVWDAGSARCVLTLAAGHDCNQTEFYDAVPTSNIFLAMLAGDYDTAFYWMDYAIDNRQPAAGQFRSQATTYPPEFHADPRWTEILRRIGRTDEWRDELCQRAKRLEPHTGISVACPVD